MESLEVYPILSESFFLSAGEANPEKEMSLPLLASKFIDIATLHANRLGIGNPSMVSMQAGWVLARLAIEMKEYPKANEIYKISTWIKEFNRHFSIRCFSVEKENGEVCGYARSVWMVMHTEKRINVGLGHFNLPSEMIDGSDVDIEGMARHPATVCPEDYEGFDPKHCLKPDYPPFEYIFQYCDLDSYRHVNTVRYIALLLNRFSLQEHDATYIKRLELAFMHEATYGLETLLYRADSNEGLSSNFSLIKAATKEPLMSAKIIREYRQ